MNIADILGTVHLNLETGDFEVQASTAADKAGSTFGSRLKKAAGGAIGAGVGLALGVALTGANQLDAATRQLQADTGMTAAEAKTAEHALAGMYRNNLQGFDQIGAAMAKVHNDLGLTGEAADKATERFLKFSTATGQDAAAAVASFDDILDSWNLTAADAAPLMDKLIAGQHRFGGSITETQSALRSMAPAMQAANMTIDDGIGLLNLFQTAGIDASKAPQALAKAVAQLKPGQDLNDLIAQIASIEDPTLRGQAAMKLFGARGGIQMAQALKPGIDSLSDYNTTAEENAGATTKAADAIESGFGAQFKMILKNAGGALAEFGTQFGGLAMVASAFGPSMVKGIASGLGGLTGFFGPKLIKLLAPKMAAVGVAMGISAATAEVAAQTTGVVAGQAAVGAAAAPAAAVAGTTIGTAMGVAASLAIVAALGVGIALAFKSVFLDPALQAQTKQIGTDVGKQIATGATEELAVSKAAIEKGIADINALPFGGFLYGDQITALQEQLDGVDAEIERRATAAGAAIPTAMAEGVESTKPVWSGKIEDLVTFFGTSMAGVKAAAGQTGTDGMLAMAAGIEAARQKPLSAFDTLKAMLKNAMTPMAEEARLRGELTSKALAAGLKSGDPAVRAQALAARNAIYQRLGELAGEGGKAGKAAMSELDKGIRSKVPAVSAAALAAKTAAIAKLNATKGPAGTAGENAGKAYAKSLWDEVNDRLSSMKWTTPWGTVTTRGAVTGHAAGVWDLQADETARIHAHEMIVPAAQAAAVRSGQATITAQGVVGAGSGGGRTVNVGGITVNNPTPEPASTSVSREMRKLAYMGSVS